MWVRVALAFALLSSTASAQTVPTRPFGTNDNSAASTAFVQQAAAPASGVTVKCTGVGATDDAAINAALTTLSTQKGGRLTLYSVNNTHCVKTTVLTIPITGTSPPQQVPIRITGVAVDVDGSLGGAAVDGGTVLDLRYDGLDGLYPAKITTLGAGSLEIDHLVIMNGGTDNLTLLRTTNTTVRSHDNRYIGLSTCSGTTCAGDAIDWGGTTTTLGGVGTNDGYQGYGSSSINDAFSKIRHAYNYNSSANGITVVNAVVDTTCGSGETHGAPFNFSGSGNGSDGNFVSGSIIEVSHYPHAASFTGAAGNFYNVISGLGIFDQTGTTLSAFYVDANSFGNAFYPSIIAPAVTSITGANSGRNIILPNADGIQSVFPGGIIAGVRNNSEFLSGVKIDGTAGDAQGLTTKQLFGDTIAAGILNITGTSSGAPSGDAVAINTDGQRAVTIQHNNTKLGNPGVNAGTLELSGSASGSLTFKTPNTVTGTITWPSGTTDFSATGGTSQVVKQVSAGAPFTVGQLAPSDLTSDVTTINGTACTLGASCSVGSPITASVTGSNVAMNNTANYFDGPSVAQGATGTWLATGTVTLQDTAGAAIIECKLWDGSTVIATGQTKITAANEIRSVALSGYLATPAGNLRISCKDPTSTSGLILIAITDTTIKASTISAIRIQ